MAKYDHGGGCPCGLQKECDCKNIKVFDIAEDLFQNLKHGSEEHQEWLKEAIRDYFDGKPIKRVKS